MQTFTQNEPLTDAELDRLGAFLQSCKGGNAMNLEEVDGFFAALITGPELDACEFGSIEEPISISEHNGKPI